MVIKKHRVEVSQNAGRRDVMDRFRMLALGATLVAFCIGFVVTTSHRELMSRGTTGPDVSESSGFGGSSLQGDRTLHTPGWVVGDCPRCPEMVLLPTGQFIMGSDPDETLREHIPHPVDTWERPRHVVLVNSAFAIGRYLVTRGEYAEFVRASGYDAESNGCAVWSGTAFDIDKGKSWRDPGFPQTERDPVVCISWDDAKAYVRWLSKITGKAYRVPSEAEWEYAARAGTTTARWWGDDTGGVCAYANGADLSAREYYPKWDGASCRDGFVYTSPVGSFEENPFGLYDILGNALEWVEDCWTGNYIGAPSDASIPRTIDGDCSRHILRGGSWYNLPRYLRAAFRNGPVEANRRINTFGFRVARSG